MSKKLDINWFEIAKQKKTFSILAKELGCGVRTITRNIKKLGLKKPKLEHIHTEDSKKRIGIGHLNEKNGMWKGNNADLGALHNWIRRRKLKPEFCEKCHKEKPYDLANKEGKNYTRNPNDYEWLCRSCHTKLDIKLGFKEKDRLGRFTNAQVDKTAERLGVKI
jgi:hypothetical protein